MVCNSREITCPLARIGFFFENCFPLILIMVSTNRKIAPIKKHFFHSTENPFLLAEYRIC